MTVFPREHRVDPNVDAPDGALDFITRGLAWQIDALCAETDPEIFFPEKGGSVAEGKAVCEECQVRAECLGYALDTGQRYGTWGGLSERQRRRLLRLPEDDSEEASAA